MPLARARPMAERTRAAVIGPMPPTAGAQDPSSTQKRVHSQIEPSDSCDASGSVSAKHVASSVGPEVGSSRQQPFTCRSRSALIR